MWKYLSTRAPAFRNFRLVAPIDVDESKDLRRGKDRIEADEYVFMYGASRACSERFSLAFHGMRSCFKILVNLASLSLSSPPIFRAACLFGQCRSRRNRLFPPFLFFLLFPFALVNNAIYIYSTEKYTDVSPARWHFRFPHSPPPPRPLSRFTIADGHFIDGGKTFPKAHPGRLFDGSLASLRKFIQRSLFAWCCICRDGATRFPRQDKWTSSQTESFHSTPSDRDIFEYLLGFDEFFPRSRINS